MSAPKPVPRRIASMLAFALPLLLTPAMATSAAAADNSEPRVESRPAPSRSSARSSGSSSRSSRGSSARSSRGSSSRGSSGSSARSSRGSSSRGSSGSSARSSRGSSSTRSAPSKPSRVSKPAPSREAAKPSPGASRRAAPSREISRPNRHVSRPTTSRENAKPAPGRDGNAKPAPSRDDSAKPAPARGVRVDDGRAILRDRPAPRRTRGAPERPVIHERPSVEPRGDRAGGRIYEPPHDSSPIGGPRVGDVTRRTPTPDGSVDRPRIGGRDGRDDRDGHRGRHGRNHRTGGGHGYHGHGHHGYCPYHPYRPDVIGPSWYILSRYVYPYGHGYYGFGYSPYDYVPLSLYFGFGHYYPYDRYYGYYGGPAPVVVDDGIDPEQAQVGALDLNVKPKDAEVYLNGYAIGTADDFDGYPSLLWLEEGEYELIFFKEGYETVQRAFYVRAGHEVNVRFELQPGVAVTPEEISQRYVAPEIRESGEGALPGPVAGLDTAEDGPASGDLPALDTRVAPGLVRLTVEPATASIYLDGRLVATGEHLAGHQGVLFIDPGEHLIEVVNPGYEPRELRFSVDPGEELDLAVPPLERLERRVADAGD